MLLEFGFFRSLVVPALLVCAENLLQEVTLMQNVHILYIYITSPRLPVTSLYFHS